MKNLICKDAIEYVIFFLVNDVVYIITKKTEHKYHYYKRYSKHIFSNRIHENLDLLFYKVRILFIMIIVVVVVISKSSMHV